MNDAEIRAHLETVREPTIWLRRTSKAHSASKLGGLPSLPPYVAWPRQGVTGTPLHFLAQIDLAHLPRTPLPGSPAGVALPTNGLLLFFADIEEEMLWGQVGRGSAYDATRVLHVTLGSAGLAPPSDIPEIGHAFGQSAGGYAAGLFVFPEAPLESLVIDTFPETEVYFRDRRTEIANELTLASIERAIACSAPQYSGAYNRKEFLRESVAVAPRHMSKGPPRTEIHIIRHQMLGAAASLQGNADTMRERGYISLLQLDSDFGVDNQFVFCDMGMAQFWIAHRDLSAGRFEKAFGTTEGG